MKQALTALVISALPAMAAAEGAVVTPYEGSFDDATFAVENAITNQGYVVDYVSHVNDMLQRTGKDLGSGAEIFKDAQIYVFCSAVVSRKVMEADPMNIAYCPYGIFVAENDDGVMIGRRDYPDGPMDIVEEMLDSIIAEAAEG
ncbi:DUF302 domain-containing protein [Palleronia caenipelagi]|uniref:DUF302 domain-containing protein n=1 Tax=Palleronia caenipelagi TaxID=2489174 RepID=A0A547PM12_9RHOB|nr:DUF302 domain-containing protein [Palleronia caenipelagi]TRD15146.1 DUF302 domain-containing protein [Palleronia caenipelagi]